MKLVFFLYKIRGRIATWLVNILPDSLYLKWKFAAIMGYPLNLKHPRTFCEKINWLKLYGVRPEFTRMVDKVEAKKYVAEIIGEQYIIPTLGVWDRVEDIDWVALPDKFVIKCSHDSGGVYICRDKEVFDQKEVAINLKKGLGKNFTKYNKEYPYSRVKPRIIAEKLMENIEVENKSTIGNLTDYKFYCFNGEPLYCQVIRNRNTNNETIDFYDMEWRKQPFVGLVISTEVIGSTIVIERPKSFEKMKTICQKLSISHPFIRVDLYEVNEQCYFGELTFYPNSGIGEFRPQNWNIMIGDMIHLPQINP